jgi:predicted RND superfamily exporter protein
LNDQTLVTDRRHPLSALFRAVVAGRWWVVAFYALVLIPSIYYATRVDQDNSLDRLIVQSDPDYVAAQEFAKVFGGGDYVVILAEAPDPFAPPALARFDDLDRALAGVPRAENSSVLSVYRRAHPGFQATPEAAEAFRKFATGTAIFHKQGLVGEHFLAVPLVLDVHTPGERQAALQAISRAIAPIKASPAPLTALTEVGQPYVDAYLDADTRRTGTHSFPLFALFVVVLNIALYRSFRTLLAFLITLGVCAASSVGYIGLTGGVFSLVSSVVPMTILITATATLVYLHSRFVEHPPGVSVDDHQIFALTNKFLACTASVFATAVGFAALSVSKIRPIREMGIWVAVGLVFTWVIVFTLFPALQKILRTPTEQQRKVAGQWFVRFTAWLPLFSYRWRWVLVPSSLVLSGLGALALFGLPGVLRPMQLQTNAVEYINHDSALYKNTKRLEKAIAGLSLTEVWLRGKFGSVSDAEVVRGLDRFQADLEGDPLIGAVIGPTTILRLMRYVGGQGDQLPTDEAGLEQLTSLLESRLAQESMLQRFVEKDKLSQTHLSVVTRTLDYEGYVALDRAIRAHWNEAVARDPALGGFELKTVGLAPLQAKISYHLVPTLVESFGLTVVIIFGTFLLVFRNGAARLMAMIPSLFAILVMFGFMRVTGMTLNVATILIASTVLGTSENDQIHFFYHFLEKRKSSTEIGLRHTLLVAGRAIFFATLINAGGFCAFAMADLPPVRQFGILSALAFILSMIADFTALPAALWMVFRERPDSLKAPHSERASSKHK